MYSDKKGISLSRTEKVQDAIDKILKDTKNMQGRSFQIGAVKKRYVIGIIGLILVYVIIRALKNISTFIYLHESKIKKIIAAGLIAIIGKIGHDVLNLNLHYKEQK